MYECRPKKCSPKEYEGVLKWNKSLLCVLENNCTNYFISRHSPTNNSIVGQALEDCWRHWSMTTEFSAKISRHFWSFRRINQRKTLSSIFVSSNYYNPPLNSKCNIIFFFFIFLEVAKEAIWKFITLREKNVCLMLKWRSRDDW